VKKKKKTEVSGGEEEYFVVLCRKGEVRVLIDPRDKKLKKKIKKHVKKYDMCKAVNENNLLSTLEEAVKASK
jgi:hypothetical protein